MIRKHSKLLQSVFAISAALAICASPAQAAAKKDFKVAWSIYVGWMPWGYAADTGIVKKWADKYGLTIEVKQFNDYVESINQYTAGAFDAVTVTNMDALSIPAAGGVDTTAVIVGDFSNGNDTVILKSKDKLADIKGRRPVLFSAVGIFIVGSVVCAVSTSMAALIIGRAIQGIGGGGLIALAQTIIGDVVPPRERSRYVAYITGVWAAASLA